LPKTPHSSEHVVVIGGGVIGAITAYYLARKGWRVTLMEQDVLGHGSSWGNCGLLLPSHVLPLNSMDNLIGGLRWMLRRDAPLHIRPRLDIGLFQWLLRFTLHCTPTAIDRAATARAALLNRACELFEALILEEDIRCEWQPNGALYLFRDESAFQHFKVIDEAVRKYSAGCLAVLPKELKEREPSVQSSVAGAWLDPGAAWLRPDRFMAEMARVLGKCGVTIMEKMEFVAFRTENRRAVSAVTSDGDVAADAFVLATGAWTPLLSETMGCRLPIQPGKGYSVTMPVLEDGPKVPCLFEELGVVATPFQSGFRLGGTMEFAGYDPELNRTRLRALLRGPRGYLNAEQYGPVDEEWYGWRPMTVDGLPFIDTLPRFDNVMVAAGHNMFGICTAPSTGSLVAEMLSGDSPHIDPLPYRISRLRI
jgi:D-amino-acid dehydrogenase